MKVFLAGATGALGRYLVPQLIEAGHQVDALTRTPAKVAALEAAGAKAVLADATDPIGLKKLVHDSRPEAVLDELTDLPTTMGIRAFSHFYDRLTPLKAAASPALLEAATEVGARIHIMQSIAFLYAPGGAARKTEDDEVFTNPPGEWSEVLPVFRSTEQAVLASTSPAGIVVRYGFFYGPGTVYAADGALARMVRRQMLPVVGDGGGLYSFVHLQDAASATVKALEAGQPGVFNVVDDEPVAMRDWLPHFANLLGARRPLHVPRWAGRIAAGGLAAHYATTLRGASNDRAKTELRWQPRYPDYLEGFEAELGTR